MGEEDAVCCGAGVMLSNLHILSQFVNSLQRMSTEMLDLALGHVSGGTVYVSDGIMASSDGSR